MKTLAYQDAVAIAIAEEDRLGLTPLENATYNGYNEYYEGYHEDLMEWVAALQYEIHGEIVAVEPTQRRSYLSAIFSLFFDWKQ